MNGFAEHGLDEDAFGEKTGNIVQAFDAFCMLPTKYFFRIQILTSLQQKQNRNM